MLMRMHHWIAHWLCLFPTLLLNWRLLHFYWLVACFWTFTRLTSLNSFYSCWLRDWFTGQVFIICFLGFCLADFFSNWRLLIASLFCAGCYFIISSDLWRMLRIAWVVVHCCFRPSISWGFARLFSGDFSLFHLLPGSLSNFEHILISF